jgi:hypothetical protein
MANKLRLFDKDKGHYCFVCPGCNEEHCVAVDTPFTNGAKWAFNGSLERPTFSPSLLIRTGRHVDPKWFNEMPEGEQKEWLRKHSTICHSFIRDGRIQFLDDCTHELKGQTVEIKDYEVKEK